MSEVVKIVSDSYEVVYCYQDLREQKFICVTPRQDMFDGGLNDAHYNGKMTVSEASFAAHAKAREERWSDGEIENSNVFNALKANGMNLARK